MPVGVLTSASYGWQAEHCGSGSTPTLNQTGELKAAFWLTSRCQLGLEGLGVGVAGEVAVLGAPARDGAGDPVHHLADERLALEVPRAAEVLLGDDVGGVLRPGGGELQVPLLEGGGAIAPVGDDGVLRSQVSSS